MRVQQPLLFYPDVPAEEAGVAERVSVEGGAGCGVSGDLLTVD